MQWWITMVVISTFNLFIALLIFFRSLKWKLQESKNAKYFLTLRVLGIIFVAVALYRTIFVSSYPERLAWFDTIFNSPFIIRCLAFFAELSFIGMIAIILLKLINEMEFNSYRKNNKLINLMLVKSPFIALGCIFLAQFFAFGGLITQYRILFAIEETLWAFAFLSISPLIVVGLKQINKHIPLEKSYNRFLIILAVWCCGYLIFQSYTLPFIHYANLSRDIGNIVPHDALKQAIFNFTATRNFDVWGGIGFFIWHSGYFSICVWMVLYFMSAPRKRNNDNSSNKNAETQMGQSI
ncbi:hypothetical protein [Bacillus sp. EAC]|uniref:hypothetical protein n=1 Tax=Bacillus sp. EAC TaxID=1978338 RepID=UPI001C4EBDAE|nr:hypothetical protein [Bacillus sp. EAC]